MNIMKKSISLLFILAILSGCSSVEIPTFRTSPTQVAPSSNQLAGYRLAPNHWLDVSKIRDEATRLSYQVSQGTITKTQAAQYLNRYRIQLVGNNFVDDSVYDVYLRSAVDSQRGAISTEQSKLYIQNALRGWQQRWPNVQNKPSNPAFTNFLMEVMGMKPLQ